jgi:putative oxidoreductase
MASETITKTGRIIYWITTGIIAAIMLWSAYNFNFNPEYQDAFKHLGLPHWFRIELTVAKILGVCALVLPFVPAKIKEFAYFGFAIVLLSTPVAHLSSGDSIWLEVGHLFFLVTLIISYLYFQKIVKQRKLRNIAILQ